MRNKLFLLCLIIVATVLFRCSEKFVPKVYLTDPLIYDYFSKYDNGTYWVMETQHSNGQLTIDTIKVQDTKCQLVPVSSADGNCTDYNKKKCDYSEILTSIIECHSINLYLYIRTDNDFSQIGCPYNNNVNAIHVKNNKIISHIDSHKVIFYDSLLINNSIFFNIYKIKHADCKSNKIGYVYFSREYGFIKFDCEDFSSSFKFKNIVFRNKFCRNDIN